MEHRSSMDDEVDIRSEIVSHVPRVVLRTKVVVVGDEAVGKTSIVQSLVSSSGCPKQYWMTLGIDFSVKEVAVNNNVTVDLFLYTTGGQSIVNQRHDIMATPIWAKANYIVCVYDIGSRVSFQNCSKWIEQVRSCSNSTTTASEVPCLLIGNKADFRNEVRCQKWNCTYLARVFHAWSGIVLIVIPSQQKSISATNFFHDGLYSWAIITRG